ncbi:MAG: hypothetical protein ACI82Q_001292 [Nonlabens sp.]|jgi:hypothetical protein
MKKILVMLLVIVSFGVGFSIPIKAKAESSLPWQCFYAETYPGQGYWRCDIGIDSCTWRDNRDRDAAGQYKFCVYSQE